MRFFITEKRARDLNDSNQALINKSMGIIRRIIHNQGYIIGENQINGVSRMQGISYHILRKETEKIEDVQIVVVYEPIKNWFLRKISTKIWRCVYTDSYRLYRLIQTYLLLLFIIKKLFIILYYYIVLYYIY